jgi:hypothetical protein
MERLSAHRTLGGFAFWTAYLTLSAHAMSVPGGDTPPPTAPRATSLDVSVADVAGQPLEGAFVMAIPSTDVSRTTSGLQPGKLRHAVTGPDGRARIEVLPPGPWTVTAHRRGFVTRSLSGVTSGPLAVRLDKGGFVTGRVVSSEGGRPLAGAQVMAAIDSPLPADLSEDATRNVATSDAQGRFRLEGIGPSPFTLSARALGHAIGERQDVKAGAVVDIVLFPGSTLHGAVRDDDGRPVSGALVRAEPDRFWGKEPPPERTDTEGRFEMAGVTPGEYKVVARLGGRAPAFGRVVVEPEAEATVTLLLSAGGFVTGRVVDEQGRPLRGVVRVDAVDELGLPASMGDLLAAESKDDGTFSLGPLPIGSLGLAASAPRHATRRLHTRVGAPRRTVALGDVTLEPGLQIRGRVRARDGRALPGATITARSEASGGGPSVEANAGAKGAFALDGLEAGWYRVTSTAPDYARVMVRAAAGGAPLDIVLEAAGAISGRVVDTQGRQVSDASVGAKARDAKLDARPQEGATDPVDGSFKIDGLAGGAYDLEARASGHAPAFLANVNVVAGRTTVVGVLTLNRGGVVSGSVVDGDGQGIPGASVYLETDPSRLTEDFTSRTDSAGAFEVRGVPAGRFRVRALHPSFTPGGVPEVRVDPAKDPVPVRIVLGPGARVEGHVRHRDGRPFTLGRVIVSSSDPSAAYGWPEPIPLDDSGAFVAEHVLPGRARVHVLAFTPRVTPISTGALTTLSQIAMQPVELREGEAAVADVALRDVVVSGRVTRGGRAASGVRISASSGSPSISFSGLGGAPPPTVAAGPPALAATTGEDGGYELLVFVPGPARVGLAAVSGQGFPAREVNVPDTSRFTLDLDIGETAVSGVVVDRDSGAPLPDASLRLSSIDGRGYSGAPGRSGPDGRFEMGAEAGEYTLSAELPGRVRVVLPVRVDPAGLADLRLEMDKGLAIVGRLQDVAGRPATGQTIVAIGADGFERAAVRADGSFRLEGLTDRPYALSVGSSLAGFATRPGVRPGPEPVPLILRQAGRVALRVVSPDGRPVAEALASVMLVDGAPVDLLGSMAPPTSEEGATEIGVPPGEVSIVVRGDSGGGFGTVVVRAGETAPLVVVLQRRPEASPRP